MSDSLPKNLNFFVLFLLFSPYILLSQSEFNFTGHGFLVILNSDRRVIL